MIFYSIYARNIFKLHFFSQLFQRRGPWQFLTFKIFHWSFTIFITKKLKNPSKLQIIIFTYSIVNHRKNHRRAQISFYFSFVPSRVSRLRVASLTHPNTRSFRRVFLLYHFYLRSKFASFIHTLNPNENHAFRCWTFAPKLRQIYSRSLRVFFPSRWTHSLAIFIVHFNMYADSRLHIARRDINKILYRNDKKSAETNIHQTF